MLAGELIARFEAEEWNTLSALIEFQGERGIAFVIGENLSDDWLSGEVIVFWEDGEHTALPEEFDLIQYNVWRSGQVE